MLASELDYELPPDRIAQRPAEPRHAARLLIVDREQPVGKFTEHRFGELPELLDPNDLLVVNDTRVLPSRLRGRKASGGRAEALLVEQLGSGRWRALVRCGGRLREGLELDFGGLGAVVESVDEEGTCVLEVRGLDESSLEQSLAKFGEAPLPPYIDRAFADPADLLDYQSVFATRPGAVAAPTASLHFTAELAERLPIETITLHVGPGTFRPLRAERLEDHALDAERFEVSVRTETALREARERGGRRIAVGTTVVRALESTEGRAGAGRTGLLIAPGHEFRAVDGLITNFHLPRSSLLGLVMAFAGIERIRAAYAHAIEQDFRFYSYGDAMWIR